MSYIGKTPLVGNYQICDALTTSATADYTLQVGGVNVSPQTANAMIVSLNGVIQGPGASRGFTVSGSTISFNSALTSSDVIDFIYIFGDVLDVGTPTDDSITTAKIVDNAVTLAKLEDGTQGDILYYGASGAPARLGFGTSGTFLKTQGTGANPAWAAAGGAWTKLKAVTLAASTASVSFVNGTDSVVIDGTYRIYKIIVDGIKGYDSTDTYVRMRVYDGGTDGTGTSEVTASEYGYSNWWCTNHTADNSGLNYGNGYAYMVIGSQGNFDDTTGSGWSGEITAYNVNQTTADNCWKYINWTTSMVSSASLYFQQAGGGGGWKSTNTVRGFKIYPNAGTWDGGTFTLYGIE